MNGLLGVAAHRSLPKGEKVGAIFWHCGEKYYVTQAEIDRIKSLPSAEEVRGMIAKIEGMMTSAEDIRAAQARAQAADRIGPNQEPDDRNERNDA